LLRSRKPQPRALSTAEAAAVLELLHSERFVDKAPGEVFATLLDEGTYLCSERTMYRILKAHNEVRERRNQARHPHYQKPQLVATGPNQVWSWDITKLRGPVKWVYYHLYVILDIFSRQVVGWMVANRESTALAKHLIRETCRRHSVKPGQLCLHADRGSSMKSKGLAELLVDLGVGKSHSRPHVSDDNPFSESQFKTLKYRPDFPGNFGSIQDARAFCSVFFDWYNNDHRHSGIAMLTPAQVHYGNPQEVLNQRHQVVMAARQAHPERFPNGDPRLKTLPAEAWINPPPPVPEATEPVLP
jgi:putative transposase